MNPLDHAKHYGPHPEVGDYGNHPTENDIGVYRRADDPILLAMQEVCRAADDIEGEIVGLKNILNPDAPWTVTGASMNRLIKATDALRNLLNPEKTDE